LILWWSGLQPANDGANGQSPAGASPLEILSGFGSQLLTGLRRTTNDENFGFQPGLGINGLPGFSGEKPESAQDHVTASGSNR
jgi:hypothetical protein